MPAAGRPAHRHRETLQRNKIPLANLSAVATVGGGAAIPLVTQRLSEQFRVPVVTTPQSQLQRAPQVLRLVRTDRGPAPPTHRPGWRPPPTRRRAWPPRPGRRAGRIAATESAADGAASATFRALAWSQDDAPRRRTGALRRRGLQRRRVPGPTDARPQVAFAHEEGATSPSLRPLPWYKRPPILFGAAAAAALLAIGGLAITLTGNSGSSGPVTETAHDIRDRTVAGQPPTSQAPQTITVTGSNGEPTTDRGASTARHRRARPRRRRRPQPPRPPPRRRPPPPRRQRPRPRRRPPRRRPTTTTTAADDDSAGDHHHAACAASGDDD